MLSPLVKEWAPEAFVISFKLETDPLILIDKSRQALEKYRHQVVVANILESRRTSVIIVTKDSQTPLSLSDEEIAQGMEIEEKIVSYLQSQHTAFIEKKVWGAALNETSEILLEREWNWSDSLSRVNKTILSETLWERLPSKTVRLFYSSVMVIVACFEKEKIHWSENVPKDGICSSVSGKKRYVALFLSHGLGELGGGEMVRVSVYKRFSWICLFKFGFFSNWWTEGTALCRKDGVLLLWLVWSDTAGLQLVLNVDDETSVAKDGGGETRLQLWREYLLLRGTSRGPALQELCSETRVKK